MFRSREADIVVSEANYGCEVSGRLSFRAIMPASRQLCPLWLRCNDCCSLGAAPLTHPSRPPHSSQPAVLVTGGMGYLGQFLVQNLATAGYRARITLNAATCVLRATICRDHAATRSKILQVAFTCHTQPPVCAGKTESFQVDLAAGRGLDDCLGALGSALVGVINSAAISQPAVCEQVSIQHSNIMVCMGHLNAS